MEKVLKAARCMDSHVSIYTFRKTKKEIEDIRRRLPKEFYVEDDSLETENRWITLSAQEYDGFDYVEITIYLSTEEEENI